MTVAVLCLTAIGCRTVPVDDPRVERAEAFERVGSWPDAAALWTEIYIASGSRNFEAGYAAARASLVANRPEEARVRLVDLDRRNPGDARVLELRGEVHEALGMTALAIDDYREALGIDPDRPRSLARLGALDVAAGRIEVGLSELARSVELDAANPRSQLEYGLAAARAGALDRAAVALDVACASKGVTDAERLEAARCFGADARVVPWLEPVVRGDPQHTEALWRLGESLAAAGRRSRGLALLERAAETDPGDVDALVSYAAGLLRSGQTESAAAIVEHARALDLSPTESTKVDEIAAAIENAAATPAESQPDDGQPPAGQPPAGQPPAGQSPAGQS